ncbi:MAG: hypothetical protein IKF90_11930, partial [Parasporobacterium sp.]|nr:hypothetical protein [Parasporobacterium sp.]
MNSKVAQAVMFSFRNGTVKNYKGKYLDLSGKYPQSFDKEQAFIREKQTGYYLRNSFDFEKINGAPFVYWMSEKMLKLFDGIKLGDVSEARIGLATGNNDYYLRLWQEVEVSKIGFGMTRETAAQSQKKWF